MKKKPSEEKKVNHIQSTRKRLSAIAKKLKKRRMTDELLGRHDDAAATAAEERQIKNLRRKGVR